MLNFFLKQILAPRDKKDSWNTFQNFFSQQWGSVNHQMAVPIPSISCCVFNNNYFFYQELNELAFNRDTCCHLVICLQLIASHSSYFFSSVVNLLPKIWKYLIKNFLIFSVDICGYLDTDHRYLKTYKNWLKFKLKLKIR